MGTIQAIDLFKRYMPGAAALGLALGLCGGGASVRPAPPAPQSPPPSSPPAPPSPSYTYPQYNHLIPTGALQAQKEGYTGKGVKVAVMDSGVNPEVASLTGRTAWFHSYILGGSQQINDSNGHGSGMAQLIGGAAAEGFPGSGAPQASLYIAQICEKGDAGLCRDYPQAYKDLWDDGVRLFNESSGDYIAQPTAFQKQGMSDTFGAYVAAGGLFVWAASNEGPDKLSFEADAPSYDPALEQGWLSVVNVRIDDQGHPNGLDPTSARCGASKDWCRAPRISIPWVTAPPIPPPSSPARPRWCGKPTRG